MAEEYHSVVVVGAGIAGLYAAHLLRRQFPDMLVVEADDSIGGRIKQLEDFGRWPVALGPEFVHGRHSSFVSLAQQQGVTFTEREWPDRCYFGKEGKLMTEDEVDDEVKRVRTFFSTFANEEKPPPGQGRDVSALEWMKSKGATDKMVAVAEACHANDFCGSLDQIGMRELVEEDRRWDFGESYLIMDRSMKAVADVMAQGVNIRVNCPIVHVEYAAEGTPGPRVTLHAKDGRKIRCMATIITVPLRILQDKVMTFSPQLPAEKQGAIDRIRMGNVIKVILGFSERFWPEDCYDVVCTDSFVPEFWMLRYPETNSSPGAAAHVVVGFVAGWHVEKLMGRPEHEMVDRFVQQLDEIFATDANPKPATKHLCKSYVKDWSKEQWVRGAYTYPTLHAEAHDREELSAPVEDCLFFAGEACNMDLNPCVHGAMDSAQQATVSVMLALQDQLYMKQRPEQLRAKL